MKLTIRFFYIDCIIYKQGEDAMRIPDFRSSAERTQPNKAVNPNREQSKIQEQWEVLKQYTQENKEAFVLRFWVKKIPLTNGNPFEALFKTMKQNMFGTEQFFTIQKPTNDASDYINIDRAIRDFDLEMFWQQLCQSNLELELPQFNKAEEIRLYLKDPENQKKLGAITQFSMMGIFEYRDILFQRYGKSESFPQFSTEREMHTYLEDKTNEETIKAIVAQEREEIVKRTTRLSSAISYLVNLKVLTFSNRKGVTLPDEVFGLKELTTINICHAELEKLPNKILELPKLTSLSLIGTQFEKEPKAISGLKERNITVLLENKTAFK